MPDDPSQRPEDVQFLSGVILVSRQPERMAEFYRDVLGLPLTEEQHDETQLGAGWLDHLKAHRAEGHDLVSRWSLRLGTAGPGR
jgi:catechol-2,3-dioxygenase